MAAVDVGGVEQRDALVERGVDHRAGAVQVAAGAPTLLPQADDGDHEPGVAEGSVSHVAHRAIMAACVPCDHPPERGGVTANPTEELEP